MTKTKIDRPLSPHLSIYRPQMTSVLSILHRATGLALILGLYGVVWFLVALAHSEAAYVFFVYVAFTPIGQLALLGFLFSLYYHLCNGIRHLIWDTGLLFDIKNATRAGLAVLLTSSLLTVGTWCYTMFLRSLAV